MKLNGYYVSIMCENNASNLDKKIFVNNIPQNPEYRPRAYIRREVFFGGRIFGWAYIRIGLKAGWISC